MNKFLPVIGLLGCLMLANPLYAESDKPETSDKTAITVATAAIPASDEDAGLEDSMTYHLYDDVDLVSTLKFEYGKPRIIIKSVFPQLMSETDNEGVNGFNAVAMQITKDLIANYRSQVKDNEATQKKLAKDKITNNLYVDYNTSYVRAKGEHLASIRFSMQGYIGGMKRSFHQHRSLNYNLDQNKEIELSELFIPGSNYLEILSDYSYRVLVKRLFDKHMVSEGTAPTPENYAIWNIKPTGILITFDTRKVAPQIYGSQTVLIPYSVLESVMSPDSPLVDCLKHKTRCLSNNVLTGGFIDEASNTRHSRFDPILSKA